MKPRVGVYLSEGMAARLSEAAKNPRATKSALVEAALGRFLGSDDDIADTATFAHHLAGLSRQLEKLDRNLRIANETAALHARFHLAVTPLMPAGEGGGRLDVVRGVRPFYNASDRPCVDRSRCCFRHDRGIEGTRSLVSRRTRAAPERLDGHAWRAGCGDSNIASRPSARLDRLA